ncbi:hypothetical protein [Microbulbifer sp. THAF38]|uniref:hypothetical protein n=1 Tax=Microbulbifer sp. THAF38 TaxID=2587856 RepID=UPI001268F0D9|nr:hypothetical protein [Microbulbifer sp. THAF38]
MEDWFFIFAQPGFALNCRLIALFSLLSSRPSLSLLKHVAFIFLYFAGFILGCFTGLRCVVVINFVE